MVSLSAIFPTKLELTSNIRAIYDDDAPVVTDVFYGHLFRHGKEVPPNPADAAYALHLAVKELQDKGRSFHHWVPFVHFGI